MNKKFFQEAYFLRRFYYQKETATQSSEAILNAYLEIYSFSKELNPDSDLKELESITLNCFCDEFYNNLKWDFKGVGRNWC